MYNKDTILSFASTVLDKMDGCYTIREFLATFHKFFTYPSTSTLYHRFGSIDKLIQEAKAWKAKQGS